MLVFLAKCFVVLLLLFSLMYVVGFIMIIAEEEEDFPVWVVIAYLVGIALIALI